VNTVMEARITLLLLVTRQYVQISGSETVLCKMEVQYIVNSVTATGHIQTAHSHEADCTKQNKAAVHNK
jgi:hypothetical protein